MGTRCMPTQSRGHGTPKVNSSRRTGPNRPSLSMTTTCLRCQAANAAASRFCQHCGQPLRPSVVDTATVLWNGVAAQGDAAERAVPVPVLFAARDTLVVGRAEDCDVRLDHPSVS